jgi:uncharacterized cupin superfamily protein
MLNDACAVVPAATLSSTDLPESPLDPAQVVAGEPVVRSEDITADDAVAIGIWEHTTGVSTDVESDEVFVVLSGRATIEVEGGPTLQVGPGDVGRLAAGARTTWTVHENLRKVYVVRD